MQRAETIQPRKPSETQAQAVNQLVVNWHITEACNYSCRYCYSSWKKKRAGRELFRDGKATRELLRELFRFFSPDNTTNPLHARLKWADLRLSVAGGEPLLYPETTTQIAHEAKALGFKLSLITNGSMLTNCNLDSLFKNLSMLGISLDSADAQTCHQIRRADKSGQVLNFDTLVKAVETARSVNPGILIKVNTVVNKFNAKENLTELVERINPDKWKILKVLSVINDELAISEQQFESFVNRHQKLGSALSAENNQDMTESYLMVDPHGRFFQNQSNIRAGKPYDYSRPILQVGAEAAFRQINFDVMKFLGRYSMFPVEVAV